MPKRRKKSKYKYATIGNKIYYFYKIVWVDPCGDAGHADVDEMKKKASVQMDENREKFSLDKMTEKLDEIMENHMKDVPQQVGLNLPKLKKKNKGAPKVKLPKLKKMTEATL